MSIHHSVARLTDAGTFALQLLASAFASALVMGYACFVTLDGLVGLIDPNFPIY